MVTVTTEAAEYLKTVIEHQEDERPLRIIFEDNQPALQFDDEQDGDQIVEHDGAPVLLLDETAQGALDGLTMDRVDTPEGPRLTFVR
jgi:Fe-S cluster assembly iron-binding protein IscA